MWFWAVIHFLPISPASGSVEVNGVRLANVLGRRDIFFFLRKLNQYLFESGTGHTKKGQTSGVVVAVVTTELFIPPWKLAKRWGGGSREYEVCPT